MLLLHIVPRSKSARMPNPKHNRKKNKHTYRCNSHLLVYATAAMFSFIVSQGTFQQFKFSLKINNQKADEGKRERERKLAKRGKSIKCMQNKL